MKQSGENYHRPLYGVGVLIVNREGQILVVEEKIPKPDSERKASQYSPPLETAKRRLFWQESTHKTLLGAMSEVLSDADLQQTRSDFRRVILPGNSILTVGSVPLFAKVEVILFDGDSTRQFTPAASDEVIHPSWISDQDFLQRLDARPWGKTLVNFANERGYLQRANLVQYKTTPVFPRRLRSIETTNRNRERKKDVPATNSRAFGRIRL